MAFCPICKSEFPPGGRCPTHGGLVETLDVEGTHTGGDGSAVEVGFTFSEPMARSWVQLLGNNGIPAAVRAGGPGFSLGGPPFGFETFIVVPSQFVQRAIALLEPFESPGALELMTGEAQ